MAITFNSTAIDGGLSGMDLYAHIVGVSGPHKIDATMNPSVSESWFITYAVIIHRDASSRDADDSSWSDRVPSRRIDRFKWTADNLDVYPTLEVLYADLKTEIASIALNIVDV